MTPIRRGTWVSPSIMAQTTIPSRTARIYYVARDGSMKGFGDYADAPAQMIQKCKEYQ